MEDWLIVLGMAAALAAAVRGLAYLWTVVRDTFTWLAEERRIRETIIDLASEKGWPNGARGLKESHNDLYEKLSSIHLSVQDLQSAIEHIHPEIRDHIRERNGDE